MNKEDLEQCESCEGYFTPDNIQSNGEQQFCPNCWDGMRNEIKKTGIDNIDEYLENRKLVEDFWIFSHAKWSGITEEEFEELNP